MDGSVPELDTAGKRKLLKCSSVLLFIKGGRKIQNVSDSMRERCRCLLCSLLVLVVGQEAGKVCRTCRLQLAKAQASVEFLSAGGKGTSLVFKALGVHTAFQSGRQLIDSFQH